MAGTTGMPARPRSVLVSLAALTAAITSGPALAQSAAAPAAAGAPVEVADDNYGGEIIVTAQKREQSLNDVGLSIAALSGETLKQRGISSLADIANAVPSLSFTNSANNTPVYTLRGVGFYETSLAAYPTVSVYIDEAPLPFPALTKHAAFDLERVEVLKGPQGTLFGQNATGGAVNFIAAKPTDTFTAGAQLSYGRFNTVELEGFVSGPLSDTIKARLSGRMERGDAWQISTTRPNDRNGKVRNYMGRLLVDFEPSSNLRFRLNVNGWRDKSDTLAPQKIGYNPQFALTHPETDALPFSPEEPRAADWTPGLPFADNSLWQVALRGDLDLTSDLTLTSITSYVDYRQDQRDEGDGTAALILDLPIDTGRIKSFSQELRLAKNGGSFRWMVGGNYESSKTEQVNFVDVTNASVNATLGTLGYPINGNSFSSRQDMRNYAVFGNAELDVGDLTFQAGARYTNSRRTASICGYDDTAQTLVGRFFFEAVLGDAAGPYTAGQCYVINSTISGVPAVDYLPFFTPGEYRNTLNEDNVSFKAGVNWKAAPGKLLYAYVAKGYKAGSYPALSASLMGQFAPVTQESVLAIEGGAKLSLIERVLQFNVAVFHYGYKDKQLRSKLIDPIFGIVDVLQNIPRSSVLGAEAEVQFRPTRGLSINATFSYLNAKIDEYVGINGGGVAANFAGTRVPYAPKYQLNLGADYDLARFGNMTAFIGGNLSYRSSTVAIVGGDQNPPTAVPQNRKLFQIDGYTIVDLRAGIRSENGWRAELWAKNVGNSYYWNNVVAGNDTIVRYAGMPRTYGITLAGKF